MTKKQGLTMKAGVQNTMLSKIKNAIHCHISKVYQHTALDHESKVKITMVFYHSSMVFIAIYSIIACFTMKI